MLRVDRRHWDELRPVTITPGVLSFAEGSALIEMGLTRVLCAATVEERVPPFLRGQGQGWVTAEYGMLPRATKERTNREVMVGHPSGRTYEIQRLIGRSLRMATNLQAIGERTVVVDCDVLQADGGTRTAAVTGGWVALALALGRIERSGAAQASLLRCGVAAVSVGIVQGRFLLDLCYQEDSQADVDCNIIMTSQGEFVEIQGTAEGAPFTRDQMDTLLDLSAKGIHQLWDSQQAALKAYRESRLPSGA
ncbi:MAG: ribonuclease PH [Chloroflexi bacterium]|nr:ribonuclease PH [Chloroflexota bacterium]